MRFVSTRWSLSAAGLVSALALAACAPSQPAAPPAPPPPMVQTAPPMVAPVVKHRWRKHSKAWHKKHRRIHKKHRKM